MADRGGVIGLVVEPETVKQGLVWGRWVHPAAPTRARILLLRPGWSSLVGIGSDVVRTLGNLGT